VDASGLASAMVGAAAPRGLSRRARIGCAAILPKSVPDYAPGAIHMAVGRSGYVGLVRLEDGSLNVAAALDARAVRQRTPGGLVAGILREAGLAPVEGLAEAPWSGTPRLRHRPLRCAGERLFALGDAAGYVEPFTGEGIGWALRAADALAPLLERAARAWTPQLARSWSSLQGRERTRAQRACRALAGLLRRPWLVHGALRVLELRPELGTPLVRRVQAGGGHEEAAWP
jgi:flavin-dependent dehydrogenase